ncbi:MAG: cache and HAMP domain-containing protein, partial [Desulfobulbaceae bacterium]|nr:cache and HAMP domain-containing protein [Desulfobulbaceae bacterium]
MIDLFQGKIGVKVGAWFVLIAVVPLVGITFITQKNTREVVVREMTAHLQDILHEKTERIELYVKAQQQVLRVLSLSPVVIEAAGQVCISPAEGGGARSSGRAVINANAVKLLSVALQDVGYHDIFLITPDGDIVYTVAEEDDLGTNLYTGPYRDSGLALVFRKAVSLLDSEISSFAYYPPSKKTASFIATPIYGKRGLLGVIAAQVNEGSLFYIFTDYIGLGESGELIAGRIRGDGKVIAAGPVRHRPDALDGEMVLDSTAALPVQLAVTGRKGAGLTKDYRDKPIIAAWGYVPSMDWGLVVKIDQDEAFAPIYRQAWVIVGVGLATLALVLGGILFATGSIIHPVKQLALVMQHFANGDFRARAQKVHDDEVGLLGDHFNEMANTIEQYTFIMEEEVAHRTQELQQAKSSLDQAQGLVHLGSWEWDIVTGKLAWSDEIYRIFGF